MGVLLVLLPLQVKSLHRGFVVICPKKKQVYRAQCETVVNDLTMELASVSALFFCVWGIISGAFRRWDAKTRGAKCSTFYKKKKTRYFWNRSQLRGEKSAVVVAALRRRLLLPLQLRFFEMHLLDIIMNNKETAFTPKGWQWVSQSKAHSADKMAAAQGTAAIL